MSAGRSYPFPRFETGNTVCTICLRTAPAHLEAQAGVVFIPCVGTDMKALSKRFDTDTEPYSREEYAEAIASLQNREDAARQVRNEQHRTQSLYNAVKNGAETALSHRHKVFYVIKGNKKEKDSRERASRRRPLFGIRSKPVLCSPTTHPAGTRLRSNPLALGPPTRDNEDKGVARRSRMA